MRYVYTNHEIPHLWAHQSQEKARNSTGTLFFEGAVIFSYGAHFPIARHVINLRGEKAVLFTTAQYSVTTSAHCAAVARAVPPAVPIFRVPQFGNGVGGQGDHAENVASYVDRISDLLRKAKRARVNRDWLEREALMLRNELRRYEAFFDVPNLPENGELDALQSWIEAHEEEERHRREERARIAEETRRREQAEQIQRFLSGDAWSNYISGVAPMLRVVGDEVQTSLGARFPRIHAMRALELVHRVRASGREYVQNGNAVRLGPFVIDRIESNGTVHAGCHVVSWEEIERISPLLVDLKE